MVNQVSKRNKRRLIAAEGYLELDLPARAHDELDAIEEHSGVRKYVEYLRGQACVAQGRYSEAIPHLEFAVKRIPAPFNHNVWQSLGICYRAEGAEELAVVAESMATRAMTVTLEMPAGDDRTPFER